MPVVVGKMIDVSMKSQVELLDAERVHRRRWHKYVRQELSLVMSLPRPPTEQDFGYTLHTTLERQAKAAFVMR